ncbi:MAG: NUDIX hydrolase [Proteobacteria bacterium]|nr:NUDIX hydrolase [Burkholderiales bacterium]
MTDAAPPVSEFAESAIESTVVFGGALLEVRRDLVRLPDGREATREYIRHPGAAIILPMLDDERVVMVRQYRYPVAHETLEFPAGKIDAGESTRVTAERELLEETGYRATHLEFAFAVHPCVGYADERIDFYLATGLVHVGHPGEDGEFLAAEIVLLSELLRRVDTGTSTEAKTMIGAYWLARRAANRR